MKKMLVVICLLMLTGCKNEIVCTKKTPEEMYETQEKIILNVEDDKVKSVKTNYIMTFDNEENAKVYSQVFESLEGEYEINLNKNKLEVSSEKNYEEYNETAEELKKEFETNGYACK